MRPRTTRLRALLFATLALAPSACSLTGVDALAIKTCVRDAQCEPLNRAYGLGPAVCERFYCNPSTRQCDLRVRSEEVCDGVDNNCDGLVDEGVFGPATGAPSTVLAGVAAGSRVRCDARGEGCFVSTGASASFVSLAQPGGAPQSAVAVAYQSARPRDYLDWAASPALQPGCAPFDPAGASLERCNAFEVALAPASGADEWFFAAVDTQGCAEGRLRVGLRTGPALALRGPTGRSNTWAGFDLTDASAGSCSGAAREGAVRGATRPALARLPDAPQALAAWLGAPAAGANARGLCGGDEVPVEALALHREEGVAGGAPIAWVTASDDARPVQLGRTRQGSPPAVLALAGPHRGYLVAFGEGAGVALRWVAPVEAPAPLPVVPTGAPSAPRPTPALRVVASLTVPRGDAASALPVGNVSLALGPSDAAGGASASTVAVAWTEGCGAASGTVHLATVRFDGAALREAQRARVATAAQLQSTAVLLLPGAVVSPGSAHAAGGELRGWLVAYGAAGALRARRVALGDGALLDERESTLAEGVGAHDAAWLPPVTEGAPARVAWWSEPRAALETTALCGPRPAGE